MKTRKEIVELEAKIQEMKAAAEQQPDEQRAQTLEEVQRHEKLLETLRELAQPNYRVIRADDEGRAIQTDEEKYPRLRPRAY